MLTIAEPIEILLVLVALAAVITSIGETCRAYSTAVLAEVECRSQAVQMLAWLRVRNEATRCAVVATVLLAGIIMAMAPPPGEASFARPYLQVVWVIVAAANLTMTVTTERAVKRIVAAIEAEGAEAEE